jgi:hypothetical protein
MKNPPNMAHSILSSRFGAKGESISIKTEDMAVAPRVENKNSLPIKKNDAISKGTFMAKTVTPTVRSGKKWFMIIAIPESPPGVRELGSRKRLTPAA